MQFDPRAPEHKSSGIVSQGRHVVYVKKAVAGIAKSSKNPKVEVTFALHDPESPECGKELFYQNYTLVGRGAGRYSALCLAINPDMPIHNPTDQSELREHLIDKSLAVLVYHRRSMWEGQEKTKAEVKQHMRLDGTEAERLMEAYGEHMIPSTDDSFVMEDDDEDDIPF